MTDNYRPVPLGKKVRSLSLEGFVITEAAYLPGIALPRHVHECATLSWVINGSFTEDYRGKLYEYGPYELQLKPAEEEHSNRFGRAGARCLFIEVQTQKLEELHAFSKLFDQTRLLEKGRLSALTMRIYKEFRMTDDSARLVVEGLVLELLGHIARSKQGVESSNQPIWLRQAKDLVHEHFAKRLTSLEVAALVGVNPARLAQMFRKHYRCTMGDYMRRLRLEHAAWELKNSNKSLVEIGLNAGFYDQSHFNRTFKLYLGVTPAAYRSNIRTSNPVQKPYANPRPS